MLELKLAHDCRPRGSREWCVMLCFAGSGGWIVRGTECRTKAEAVKRRRDLRKAVAKKCWAELMDVPVSQLPVWLSSLARNGGAS
jgi:hypothetical protein